jgi:hypothetical protein
MAKEIETVEGPSTVGYDQGDYEWTTVHTEAADQVQFNTVGDVLVGIYAGHEVIYPDLAKGDTETHFVQLHWTVPGGAVFMNAGHEMRKAYTETKHDGDGNLVVTDIVPIGSMTRNELMKLVDTGKATEMNSVRVDVATPRNADNPA